MTTSAEIIATLIERGYQIAVAESLTGGLLVAELIVDMVEISRMEKLVANTPPEQIAKLFSATELADAGEGARRIESLAARFAAKEACCKLFPRETTMGTIEPCDFSVRRNGYGAPEIEVSGNARAVLDRNRIAAIRVSLTHTSTSASAVAMAEPRHLDVPWFGKGLYHLFPYRRGVVLGNMRRVFGDALPDADLIRLAQAYYGHYVRFMIEFFKLPLMSAGRKKKFIRVENMEAATEAHRKGKGLIMLTGPQPGVSQSALEVARLARQSGHSQ